MAKVKKGGSAKESRKAGKPGGRQAMQTRPGRQAMVVHNLPALSDSEEEEQGEQNAVANQKNTIRLVSAVHAFATGEAVLLTVLAPA
jgi:hypothetical protein